MSCLCPDQPNKSYKLNPRKLIFLPVCALACLAVRSYSDAEHGRNEGMVLWSGWCNLRKGKKEPFSAKSQINFVIFLLLLLLLLMEVSKECESEEEIERNRTRSIVVLGILLGIPAVRNTSSTDGEIIEQ